MRIIKLHVENFGKLHNVDLELNPGLNSFTGKNGTGKSTLAAFISVMFFGFQNEGKRKDLLANERVRYYPWQGGIFGGSITFETGGKIYRVERSFSKVKRKNSDTFKLIDCETNRMSDDLSENIGEDLFHIDPESFRKTVFIGQNDRTTSATARISSMIGNVTDQDDDLENYEKAQSRFRDEINRLSETRKNGSLKQLRDSINLLKMQIREKNNIINKINALKESVKDEKKHLSDTDKKIRNYAENQDKAVDIEKRSNIINNYDTLKNELHDVMEMRLNEEKIFNEKIPGPDEIKELSALADKLSAEKAREYEYRLTSDESEEFKELKNEFGSGVPEDKEIEEISKKIKTLSAMRKYQKYRKKKKVQRTSGRRSLTAGMIMLISGVCLLTADIRIAGYIFCAVGILSIIIMLIKNTSAYKVRDTRHDNETGDKVYSSGFYEYQDSGRKAEDISDEIEMFVRRFSGENVTEEEYGIYIERIINDKKRYITLSGKTHSYILNEREITETENEIRTYLRYFLKRNESAENVKKCIFIMQEALIKIEEYKKREHDIIEKIIKTESENDIPFIKRSLKDAEDMKEDFQEINDIILLNKEKELSLKKLSAYNESMIEEIKNLDSVSAAEEKLGRLEKQYADDKKKLEIIKKTSELLKDARDKFTSSYIEPIKDSFNRYYALLADEYTEENDDDINAVKIIPEATVSVNNISRTKNTDYNIYRYEFDSVLNLYFTDHGQTHSAGTLSCGLTDLTEICRRMAFIDAMYDGEKPFLVFDDPFVNLDDEKYDNAVRFLKKISCEYQIIYFSCSSKRNSK